jgi:adenylate kinase
VDESKLVIRNDDREEVISGRLAAYETETKPVADYYRAQRRLVAVNADRPMEDVTAEIFGVIDSHCKDSHCQGGC